MGADPKTSALNRYLQSWDVSNVFVNGANAFPHNNGYNPTGLIGGLAYWAAKAIRENVRALHAYFLHGDIAPVNETNRDVEIPWPLSMRWPLAIRRKTFAPDADAVAFDPGRYSDPQLARGAYLVQGLGHCGSCHTPRGFALQEKALDESGGAYLSGGQVIGGRNAVNLRGNSADGLGRWSTQDIVDTLRTARNAHSAVVGTPMADVVTHSTQKHTDEDLQAMAVYLKQLPASGHCDASTAAWTPFRCPCPRWSGPGQKMNP
jgi:mono/diheme cytochrome c family protein